jgi:hypothetical protein
MASLPDIQARFAAALRGDTQPVEPDIVGDGLQSAARLRIYRNNSHAMFEGALERTYPVLRRRVGDEYFRRLALGHRERHPSRSGDLHFVGQHFPTYMADVQAGTGYEWLAELAALEWACETALVEVRERPLGVDALAGLGPEDLANVRLRLQPSLRCVASSVPVLDVWRANQPHADGAAVDLLAGAQCVLVSCGEDGLELREVAAPTFEFARLLQQGASLGEAVDRSALALESVPGALGLLFESDLVTGVLTGSTAVDS